MPRPPQEIYVQGRPDALSLLTKLPERGLAIVGTRSCQQRSLQLVRSVLNSLAGFDLVILSGLALGVDTEAHECALASNFPTIAFQACGVDLCYPRRNRGLKHRILDQGGLVVSELEPGTPPLPGYFIERNRLIAGWAKATWVVEAGERSGALNTACWATRQDRPCFATTAYPGDPAFAGNLKILADRFGRSFQSAASLGEVWLELESFLSVKRARAKRQPKVPMDDTSRLCAEAMRLMNQEGIASLSALVAWSTREGWTPPRLFEHLERAVRTGRLIQIMDRLGPTSFEFPAS